jgi:tRNA(Ile)-lysidine synthase
LTLNPRLLFQEVATDQPVLVAVSGGSDSIALLLLAASWAQTRKVELQVVTVDHGLRPEAAAEAAFVAGVSEALNLPHITLAWDGIKPVSGISQAARSARYRLLEEYACDTGAGTILAGHTANDQAETILMRSLRGDASSGGRGLSGMSRMTVLPEGTLLRRPLLGVTRQALRDYLSEMNQSWIEDPSNQDSAYERVRIRRDIGDDEPRIRSLCRFGDLMGRYRKQLAIETAEFLSGNLGIDQGPVYGLSAEAMTERPGPLKFLALQVAIAISGGGEYFVSTDIVSRVLELANGERMTAGNAVIERVGNRFRFYRETRNLPALLIAPGEQVLWDGRVAIENNANVSYFCSAPTPAQLKQFEQLLGRKLDVKPRPVLGSTPYLSADGDDMTLPFVHGFRLPEKLKVSLAVRAIEHYCPEHDLALLELVNWLKKKTAGLKSRQA